jgi:hypothetical protein
MDPVFITRVALPMGRSSPLARAQPKQAYWGGTTPGPGPNAGNLLDAEAGYADSYNKHKKCSLLRISYQ